MSQVGKHRNTAALVLLFVLTLAGGFAVGKWYESMGGPIPGKIAYGFLSGLSDATNAKILADYEKDQRELAQEAARLAADLAQATRNRETAQAHAKAAQLELELLRSLDTVRALEESSAAAEKDFDQAVVVITPGNQQAEAIKQKAVQVVSAYRAENTELKRVVEAQAVVIQRQGLVISEYQSEVAQYERNLILWKDRYRKAEKHINRMSNRKARIAVGILGVAAGVYVGSKWL